MKAEGRQGSPDNNGRGLCGEGNGESDGMGQIAGSGGGGRGVLWRSIYVCLSYACVV